jgi:MinD superfamily P-loop ATPase
VRTYCAQQNIEVLAELPYDSDMIAAHRAGVPVVEFSDGPAAKALKKVADRLLNLITENKEEEKRRN